MHGGIYFRCSGGGGDPLLFTCTNRPAPHRIHAGSCPCNFNTMAIQTLSFLSFGSSPESRVQVLWPLCLHLLCTDFNLLAGSGVTKFLVRGNFWSG